MKQTIAFAAFLAAALASAGVLAACPPPDHSKLHAKQQKTPPKNCVDLDLLPQISANIVAVEPLAPPRPKSPPSFLDSKPYNGPSIGLTKPDPGVKPTPTVGYHWSID